MAPSCILFESRDRFVVVVDVPRSIEESQVPPGSTPTRRLVSAEPVREPWEVPRPKKDRPDELFAHPASAAISELMALESVKSALETLKHAYQGPWCLPRQLSANAERARLEPETPSATEHTPTHASMQAINALAELPRLATELNYFLPASCDHLLGSIQSQRDAFCRTAPEFDLIVVDPPWPSRSVKRKRDGYSVVYNMEAARDLLSLIPVSAHLKPSGLVAVWVTNKSSAIDLLTSHNGVFASWGLEPIGEWIWLKVTSSGEPVIDIDSTWRKPWERLFIARKKGSLTKLPVERKVIVGVPDIHSRKPNLRHAFEDIFPAGYLGLEVFARNLTAGWWGWGDEVLHFQHKSYWRESSGVDVNVDS